MTEEMYCFRCKEEEQEDDKLVLCLARECKRVVHNKCMQINESKLVEGVLAWYCPFHNESTGAKAKTSLEKEPVVNLIDTTNNDELCERCKTKVDERNLVGCYSCFRSFHYGCLIETEKHRLNGSKTVCDRCKTINNNNTSNLNYESRRGSFNGRGRSSAYGARTFHNNRQAPIFSSPRASVENRPNHIQGTSNFSPIALANDNSQYALNESLHSIQKITLMDLPLVDDNNLSWTTFYDSYQATKRLFLPHEQISRIKKAIKNPDVLQIGGPNLFNSRTFDLAIEKINSRLSKNTNFINKEANALQSLAKLKAESHRKIIEYIDRIANFNITAKAYDDWSFICNKMFINGLAEKLPVFLYNKWINKQANVEQAGEMLKLQHLVDVLEQELPNVNTRYQNSLLPSFDNLNIANKSNRMYKTEDKLNEARRKFDSKYCWFHKNTYHPSHECRNLWDMDGKSVALLAEKNRRCIICGQEQHNPCPHEEKLKCKVEECEIKHHALYCPKRESRIRNNNHNDTIVSDDCCIVDYDQKELEDFQRCLNESGDLNSYNNNNHGESSRFFITDESFDNSTNNIHYTSYDNNNAPRNYRHEAESFSTYKSSPVLLGVIVLNLENKQNAAFLVDSGSSVSLIEEKLANKLELYGPNLKLSLKWTGNHERDDKDSRIVKIKVAKAGNQWKDRYLYFRTMHNLKVCNQRFVAEDFKLHYPYLKELNLSDYSEISGIIGIDNIFMFETQTIKAKNHLATLPLGVKCPLGDYVMQSQFPLEDTYKQLLSRKTVFNAVAYNNSCKLTIEEQLELKSLEEEISEMELEMGKCNDRNSYEDTKSLEIMERDIKRELDTNHFTASLLWKRDDVVLPTEDSYKLALKRYFVVEKNAKISNKFEECEFQVKNLIEKAYAKELTYDEVNLVSNKTFYVPIFFIHPEGKRMRMIWDLAAKVNGKSLNDELMSGPNLYSSILKIMFQLAEHQYLVKGDLQEMFHQIRLKEEDSDSLRFIFRFFGEEKIRIFKMKVLPFGAKCSPTISQFVKNLIAKENLETNKLAAETILHSTYVDDVIKSFDNFKTAKQMPIDIQKIMKTGGFNFLKINSNNKEVVAYARNKFEELDIHHEKLFSSEESEKLLGYKFNFESDTLSLAFSFNKIPDDVKNKLIKPTRRQILKLLMSIYDPIGFVQFLTSKFKLLYHKVCLDTAEWDDQILDKNLPEWHKILDWLAHINNIQIPRSYYKENYAKVELWAFGDAGKDMLCGVIFARYLDKDENQMNVRLIYAKTFIVPEKTKRTIPELELQSSLNLCKMVATVLKSHETKFDKIRYFTDSSSVFEWIRNEPKKPTIFVHKKIEEIHSMSEKDSWNWIPTDYNPADYGTKESAMVELKYDNDWFLPRIFRLPQRDWPRFEPIYNVTNHITENLENKLDPGRFKSYNSIIYAGQFFYRLKHKLKIKRLRSKLKAFKKKVKSKRLKQKLEHLRNKIRLEREKCLRTSFMYEKVENLIIKQAQEDSFPEELKLIQNNMPLPKNNYYHKWLPFLDKNGIIRLQTRLNDSKENRNKFGYDRINPILLHKEHKLTELLILRYHKANYHMLTKNVINLIKMRFFIRNLDTLVKQTVKTKCSFCIRHNSSPKIPLMGDIPAVRLKSHVPPFSYTIADIAGPITVKVTRNTVAKRYIFVYSCLTSRALHLELIEDLTTNSTLLALQNSIHLRGAPFKIITDNGTNFVGANNKLREICERWNRELLAKGCVIRPIDWDFGPARAPHMQGAVERMVALMKTAIKKVLLMIRSQIHKLNDFQIRAILMEVIGLLNNRPLTLAPLEDSYNEFLTPNSFILLRSNFQEVPLDSKDDRNLYKTWEDIRLFTKKLWDHWILSYLPTILDRKKWTTCAEPLQVGDIVITVDTSILNSWRLGKIVKIKLGSKNQVRQVEVLLGKRGIIDNKSLKSKDKLMDTYINERQIIVTRPATAVAKIKINNNNN